MVSKKLIRKASLSAVACGALLFATTSTHAGFQWVPAEKTAPKMTPEPMDMLAEPVPMQHVEQEALPLKTLPALHEQDMSMPQATSPAMAPIGADEPKMKMIDMSEQNQSQDTMHTKVMMPDDAPQTAMKQMGVQNHIVPQHEETKPKNMVVALNSSEILNAETVMGFGSDMPLALALRQVVPASYAFSFGTNVNPGYRVSWNGGRSWDLVVAEMVAPLDLVPVISGKVIHIKNIAEEHNEMSVQHSESMSKAMPMSMPKDQNNDNAPIMLSRTNIVDPGSVAQNQRPETIDHIQNLENTQKADAPESIEDMMPLPDLKSEDQRAHKEQVLNASAGKQFWEAQKGDSLKDTLARWSAQTNTALVWEASRDYTISDHIFVNDTYTNALRMLFEDMESEDQSPTLRLIGRTSHNDKNKLIIGDLNNG